MWNVARYLKMDPQDVKVIFSSLLFSSLFINIKIYRAYTLCIGAQLLQGGPNYNKWAGTDKRE